MFKIDKWSILAGLRFFLASIVAINHLADYTDLGPLVFIPNFGTFEAILGFLLISGYSISVSYIKEPKHFIFRRFKRIYPIYIASIIITFIVEFLIVQRSAPPPAYLIFNLLFLNQLFTTTSYVGPAWSLSLEFWLYCLAPKLLSIPPNWTRCAVYISFVSFLFYTTCRTLVHLPYYSGVGYGGNLLFLSFIWICGLRLAREGQNSRSILFDIRWIFSFHIAAAAGIQFLFRVKHHSIGIFFRHDLLIFAMQSMTLCLVYIAFSKRIVSAENPRRRSRCLRFLGDISYPLYLIHIPIYIALAQTPLKAAGVYYLTALVLSGALYWIIDVYSRRRHLQLPVT